MAKTFKVTGTCSIPQEDGQTPATVDLAVNFDFTQQITADLSYTGAAADDAIDLETMASGGAKALLIKSSVGGCTVKINGAATSIPVGAGSGFILIVNPSGSTITAVSVTVTGVAKVKVVALA